jgi:Type VI secretion system VasI, EvfG, VC_A0118
MRAMLMIACAGVVIAAGAQAQEGLRACRQIKDDADRLKCYDALDISSPNTTPTQPQSSEGEGGWQVRDEKSPLDDSPLVSAQLPSSDGKAWLLMRCKDHKTEVAVNKWGFVKCGSTVRVIYRVDQAPAVDEPWNSHSSCVLAIAPAPIPFIRSLTDGGQVYFRMWDHHDAPHDVSFNLGKVSDVRARIAQACEWDKAAENPASPKARAR